MSGRRFVRDPMALGRVLPQQRDPMALARGYGLMDAAQALSMGRRRDAAAPGRAMKLRAEVDRIKRLTDADVAERVSRTEGRRMGTLADVAYQKARTEALERQAYAELRGEHAEQAQDQAAAERQEKLDLLRAARLSQDLEHDQETHGLLRDEWNREHEQDLELHKIKVEEAARAAQRAENVATAKLGLTAAQTGTSEARRDEVLARTRQMTERHTAGMGTAAAEEQRRVAAHEAKMGTAAAEEQRRDAAHKATMGTRAEAAARQAELDQARLDLTHARTGAVRAGMGREAALHPFRRSRAEADAQYARQRADAGMGDAAAGVDSKFRNQLRAVLNDHLKRGGSEIMDLEDRALEILDRAESIARVRPGISPSGAIIQAIQDMLNPETSAQEAGVVAPPRSTAQIGNELRTIGDLLPAGGSPQLPPGAEDVIPAELHQYLKGGG